MSVKKNLTLLTGEAQERLQEEKKYTTIFSQNILPEPHKHKLNEVEKAT